MGVDVDILPVKPIQYRGDVWGPAVVCNRSWDSEFATSVQVDETHPKTKELRLQFGRMPSV